jgi:hypothetical protein
MMKKPLLVIFAILFSFEAVAQSTNIPLNDDVYHWLSRYEIKTGRIAPEWFTTVRTIKRDQAIAYLDSLKARDSVFSSPADRFNYAYFQNDSWEWSKAASSNSKKPFLKRLYGKKSDMGYVDEPGFDLHVSPVLHLGAGKDSRLDETATINTRGVEIRGMIDQKIGFYTYITENQLILPSYVKENYFGVPHEGFVKPYKTTGFDFFQARAYIDFNITKHVYFQFGHDRTFIGNGYRSLVYSDHSPPNLFLKVNAKVWKINYLFQLNRLTANDPVAMTGVGGGKRYLDRYLALHHASINIGKKFNLGIFESIVFTPDDPVNRGNFDLSYLNPIIFYRAIEQQFGSSDNALLGLDFKWNAFKGISFYGQALLDEFVIAEIRAGKGWWGNKYAFQLGGKYIDVAGISNLDLQLEYNTVRPFTYSHNTGSSYSNYSQPLAHPLGANFNELVAIVRYQPLPKLNLTAKMIMATVGRDGTNENYGSNVLKDYTTRQSEYGNFIGQGHRNDITFLDASASYMLKHNLFLELRQTVRKSECDLAFYNTNTSLTSLGLRWNIPARTYEF